MKILINKAGDTYTLSIISGHFNGSLTSISRENMELLKDEIESLLNDRDTHTIIWNPRSKRHEQI